MVRPAVTQDAIAFFRRHAGGVVGRETETARALAEAEAESEARGWKVEWEHDQDSDVSWMDDKERKDYESGRLEVLSALLRDENGEVLASLGGIAVMAHRTTPDPYGRVVEAELALEALTDFAPGERHVLLTGKLVENSQWTRKYIDDLPDTAFLHIERGGEKHDGRTHPLSLRHFPFKNEHGNVDYAHLKNALSRIPQSALPESTKRQAKAKAEQIFEREFGHAKNARGIYGGTVASDGDYVIQPHHRGGFAVDRVGRGGTHTTIGPTRGYPSLTEALGAAKSDAHKCGTSSSAAVYKQRDDELSHLPYAFKQNAMHPMRQPTRGPRPWQPGSGRPEPTPHAIRRMVHSSEERRREEHRPFDPEAPRAHDAKPHHFAVNPSEEALLRDVMLGDTGYRLVLWDTFTQDRGKSILGFAFYEPGVEEPLFEGEDYGASPMQAIDSDESLRGLLGFLTLRPGDTDREYFKDYSPRQLTWAQTEAEELQLWAMDDEPYGEFVDAA